MIFHAVHFHCGQNRHLKLYGRITDLHLEIKKNQQIGQLLLFVAYVLMKGLAPFLQKERGECKFYSDLI